ncbi:MAG: hypothetical protein E7508_09490 [Ruminococcus sp.]|nr:hypothetical protein [Ruminococcus sp.]
MLKKYFTIIIFTIILLSGCGAKREYYTESEEHIFDEEFINYTPDYVTALLPEDMTKEEAYNSFPENLLEHNLAKYGRYDGLEMGNYGTAFYPTSKNQGFVLKLYGVNQSIMQSVAEVYFFDGKDYKLIHYIDDATPGSHAITDTKRLYIPLNNGTLRSIDISGDVKDYYEAFDANNGDIDIRMVFLNGDGNEIELENLKGFLGSVCVE